MLAAQIADLLRENGYQWTRNGQLFSPTDSDVEKVLDEAVRALYAVGRDEGTPQYERGGIIVQRTNDNYDVFVRIGEMT